MLMLLLFGNSIVIIALTTGSLSKSWSQLHKRHLTVKGNIFFIEKRSLLRFISFISDILFYLHYPFEWEC